MKLKYYFFKRKKIKRILIIFILFGIFAFLSVSGNFGNSFQQDKLISNPNNEGLKSQDLDSSNAFTGTGESWNVTHWANRTDYNLAGSFSNGTTDMLEIPLGLNWEGYQLDSSINNLYDTRNWNNGTFNFGNDDGTYAAGEDDTAEITNPYQNWTFNSIDGGTGTNPMSGNYLDSAYGPSDGHNCVELRMDGDPTVLSGYYNYNENDRCWWNSTFIIPRGIVISSTLEFEVNPNYLANFNSWDFGISINGQQIYGIGTYSLKQLGEGSWHGFSIPSSVWVNQSEVFSSPINDYPVSIEFSLEYVATTASYSNGFTNIAYQQVFVDNLKLVSTAEAKPSQLQLKLNSTSVNDVDWGAGSVSIGGSWQTSTVSAIFSSDDTWSLSGYSIDFVSNLNLYATKESPETSYDTNFVSEGTKFSVENGSMVNWEAYSYFAVPTGYSETTMRLEYPSDITITWVSEPQLPSTNRLSLCDASTPGVLNIPVDSISATPDGFWKFEATSPNHLSSLNIFRNTTQTPNPFDWSSENVFYSGDYINITAKVNLSPLFSSYITQTKALLQIKFPNGTIWEDKSQYKNCDSFGNLYFDYFQIPTSPPNYEVGDYAVIITWNNSYSTFGLNESGLIYKNFRVIHDSRLVPDQGIYFFENVLDNRILNIKVSFNDKINLKAIENAVVYTNYSGSNEYFGEISPGFYLLEFNASSAIAGNNTLTIFANSSYYLNKVINMTVDVVKETTLTVDNEFLSAPWKQNFTLQLNYTEKVNPSNGVSTNDITTNWAGPVSIVETSQGHYSLTFNTSIYSANTLESLIINFKAYKYQPQSVLVTIQITELGTDIKLYLNEELAQTNQKITIDIFEQVNVTVKYEDSISSNHLSGANVFITGSGITENLTENVALKQYTIMLNGTDLGETIATLSIFAQKENYNLQIFPFIVEVREGATHLKLIINNLDKTEDPVVELPIGTILNMTVKYLDDSNNTIQGADVQLIGQGLTVNFNESIALHQYYTIINTTTELGIKVNLLSIVAQKANYQTNSIDPRITIRRINGSISTLTGNPTFSINPSDEFKIRVVLTDQDFGGTIKGATVTYRWEFGQGTLTYNNDTRAYESKALKPPVGGPYTITINAIAGDKYDFVSYEIYLSVIQPSGNTFWFWLLLIVSGIAILGLISYLIAYQRVLKYPKPVRKVRKYRKTLQRKKVPSMSILSRDKAFEGTYKSELAKTSKSLVGKPSEVSITKDNVIAKKGLK